MGPQLHSCNSKRGQYSHYSRKIRPAKRHHISLTFRLPLLHGRNEFEGCPWNGTAGGLAVTAESDIPCLKDLKQDCAPHIHVPFHYSSRSKSAHLMPSELTPKGSSSHSSPNEQNGIVHVQKSPQATIDTQSEPHLRLTSSACRRLLGPFQDPEVNSCSADAQRFPMFQYPPTDTDGLLQTNLCDKPNGTTH